MSERGTRGPDDHARLRYNRGPLGFLWDLLGASIMVPLGALVLGGATVGAFERSESLARASVETRLLAGGAGLLAVLVGLSFGLVLLYYGLGMLFDGLGWRVQLEGAVSNKREVRGHKGGSTLYFTVRGAPLVASRTLWNLVREGDRVRVEVGRWQRVVYKLWSA